MAKEEKKKRKAASQNIDDMTSGGLPTDFDGEITKVRATKWDYDGKVDPPVLAVAVTITPVPESGIEEFVQHYSAGKLEEFAPSMDDEGDEMCDMDSDDPADWEGKFCFPVGTRDVMSKTSNWGVFLKAARDAGLPASAISADVTALEGTFGHFNRIPQPKRSGLIEAEPEEGQQKRVKEILVLTEVRDNPNKKGSKTKAKANTKGKAAEAEEDEDGDEDDLGARLEGMIVKAVKKAGGTLEKRKAGKLIADNFEGKEKSAALKLLNDAEFYENSDKFDYDEDDDSFTLPS